MRFFQFAVTIVENRIICLILGKKQFIIIDAAINDLIRPALYNARHPILPVVASNQPASDTQEFFDIVGPVCETGDILGKEIPLHPLKQPGVSDRNGAF